MNVALIDPSYPSERCGIATYTGFLAEGLASLVKVTPLGRAAGPLAAAAAHARADLIHVQHAFDLFGYMGYRSFAFYRALAKLQTPIVTTIHELPPARPPGLKGRLAAPYLWQCVEAIGQASQLVLVHTRHAAAQLRAGWPAWAERVSVMPHGTISAAALSQPRAAGRTPPVIGFFGFLSPDKGVHQLIEALPALPAARLVIAGGARAEADRRYRAQLLELIARHGLADRVTLRDYLEPSALADFFGALDLAVFPYEKSTASGALHIALAHGCPVLATDLPPFRELAEDYGCLATYSRGDQRDLGRMLVTLIGDPAMRQALYQSCHQLARATAWPAVAERHVAIYAQLIDKSEVAR